PGVTAGQTRLQPTLAEHLRGGGNAAASGASGLAAVLEALAGAGIHLAGEIARAALVGGLGATGEVNADGDPVRRLDRRAHALLLDALESSGVVAAVASEELPGPVVWPRATPRPLAVCLDPLDGSLNSDVAGVLGTIFGIRPATRDRDPAEALLGAGTEQVAA